MSLSSTSSLPPSTSPSTGALHRYATLRSSRAPSSTTLAMTDASSTTGSLPSGASVSFPSITVSTPDASARIAAQLLSRHSHASGVRGDEIDGISALSRYGRSTSQRTPSSETSGSRPPTRSAIGRALAGPSPDTTSSVMNGVSSLGGGGRGTSSIHILSGPKRPSDSSSRASRLFPARAFDGARLPLPSPLTGGISTPPSTSSTALTGLGALPRRSSFNGRLPLSSIRTGTPSPSSSLTHSISNDSLALAQRPGPSDALVVEEI